MGLKIGLIGFGSAIRGVVPEEESISNAAIVEASAYKLLIDRFDAHFYIIGPIQVKTRNILDRRSAKVWRHYLNNFTICESKDAEPESLDLIWIQSGPTNLDYTTYWRGLNAPFQFFMYCALKKYSKCPVVYFQTDFASILLYSGDGFGSLYQKLFPVDLLWGHRDLHIFVAGSTSDDALYRKYNWMYKLEDLVKIHTLEPDLHFLIDLEDIRYTFKVQPVLRALSFSGKQRCLGSRDLAIAQYVQSGIPFNLAGKWSPNTINKLSGGAPKFRHWGRFPFYEDVLCLYNVSGSALYLSTNEYIELGVVTSRFYDALKAKAIPLIDERSYSAITSQFKEIENTIGDLVVSPANIDAKLKSFRDPDKRENILNRITHSYKAIRPNTCEQFIETIKTILASKPKQRTMPLKKDLHRLCESYKVCQPTTALENKRWSELKDLSWGAPEPIDPEFLLRYDQKLLLRQLGFSSNVNLPPNIKSDSAASLSDLLKYYEANSLSIHEG